MVMIMGGGIGGIGDPPGIIPPPCHAISRQALLAMAWHGGGMIPGGIPYTSDNPHTHNHRHAIFHPSLSLSHRRTNMSVVHSTMRWGNNTRELKDQRMTGRKQVYSRAENSNVV